MFLKPANSNMENGFKKKYTKRAPIKIHIQRKLETGKDTFERQYIYNTAMGVDYLT